MSNHQSILVPLGLEFSRWCFIGVFTAGAFWNPSKSRTCMIWVVHSGLQSRYSLSVLGAFCVPLYATIVFPWYFGSAFSCIMCIESYFLNHTKWQSFKVRYILWDAHPPSHHKDHYIMFIGYANLNLPRLHPGKTRTPRGSLVKIVSHPNGCPLPCYNRGPPQESKVTWENRDPKDWQVAFVPWFHVGFLLFL